MKPTATEVIVAAAGPLIRNRDGGGLSTRAANTVVTTLGAAAGIGPSDDGEPFGPHVLRHTFGTDLVRGHGDLAAEPVDVVLVAELMGHADLNTTRRYTLPTDADKTRAPLGGVEGGAPGREHRARGRRVEPSGPSTNLPSLTNARKRAPHSVGRSSVEREGRLDIGAQGLEIRWLRSGLSAGAAPRRVRPLTIECSCSSGWCYCARTGGPRGSRT
ncbi:tyrosine-type recombinase/integrase [Nocardiopsis alba]|uniref:tyrosine-type recombinase/integrase n=1 Tax=Nocardiopsis alba TaxID=53437 RepID=UPI001EED7050|nr:tyrosine-type recombinase/integrase [Nocardiopsis alba]